VALKRSNIVVALLIVVNLAFLGWVGRVWIESFTGGIGGSQADGPDTPEAVDGRTAVTQRALSVHLPLDGSASSEPGEGEPCERLEGFLLDAAFHLEAQDTQPPMGSAEIKALTAKKRCSVKDPEVANALSVFRDVWLETGLQPVGPFSRK
jgi:hypothetical protein